LRESGKRREEGTHRAQAPVRPGSEKRRRRRGFDLRGRMPAPGGTTRHHRRAKARAKVRWDVMELKGSDNAGKGMRAPPAVVYFFLKLKR